VSSKLPEHSIFTQTAIVGKIGLRITVVYYRPLGCRLLTSWLNLVGTGDGAVLLPGLKSRRFTMSSGSRRLALIALAAWLGLALATPASAIDTIDCARDWNAAERTICKSQALQVLDAKMTEAYADLMLDQSVSGRTKMRLQQSQRDFLDRRDRCGADRQCLEEVMQQRVTRIHYFR
jgi:uncharacterized protein YecT (DUF1311 family)